MRRLAPLSSPVVTEWRQSLRDAQELAVTERESTVAHPPPNIERLDRLVESVRRSFDDNRPENERIELEKLTEATRATMHESPMGARLLAARLAAFIPQRQRPIITERHVCLLSAQRL